MNYRNREDMEGCECGPSGNYRSQSSPGTGWRRFLLSVGKWAMALGGAALLNLALDVSDSQARKRCLEIQKEKKGVSAVYLKLRKEFNKEKDLGRKSRLKPQMQEADKQRQRLEHEWFRRGCEHKVKAPLDSNRGIPIEKRRIGN
jgi:hypothetical protein